MHCRAHGRHLCAQESQLLVFQCHATDYLCCSAELNNLIMSSQFTAIFGIWLNIHLLNTQINCIDISYVLW